MLRALRERRHAVIGAGRLSRTYAVLTGRDDAIEEQLEVVRRFYDEPPREKRVIGFKTKVSDVWDLASLKEILESRHVRAIVMVRRNLVKLATSHLTAGRLHARTGAWNVQNEEARTGPQEFSVEEFDRMLRRVVFDDALLRAYSEYLDARRLVVEYEDLLRDRNAWLQSILEFLEAAPQPLDSSITKNTDDDLRTALVNFDQIRRHYAGTPFAPMFDERIN